MARGGDTLYGIPAGGAVNDPYTVCNVDRSNPDGSGFGRKHLEMKDWPVERGIDRSNSVRAPLTYSFDLGSEWRVRMIGRSMLSTLSVRLEKTRRRMLS